MLQWNPYVRAIVAGVVAALLAFSAALASGEGVSAAEWVTVALALIAGTGIVKVNDQLTVLTNQVQKNALALDTLTDRIDSPSMANGTEEFGPTVESISVTRPVVDVELPEGRTDE